jgi:hypothetical protein
MASVYIPLFFLLLHNDKTQKMFHETEKKVEIYFYRAEMSKKKRKFALSTE